MKLAQNKTKELGMRCELYGQIFQVKCEVEHTREENIAGFWLLRNIKHNIFVFIFILYISFKYFIDVIYLCFIYQPIDKLD